LRHWKSNKSCNIRHIADLRATFHGAMLNVVHLRCYQLAPNCSSGRTLNSERLVGGYLRFVRPLYQRRSSSNVCFVAPARWELSTIVASPYKSGQHTVGINVVCKAKADDGKNKVLDTKKLAAQLPDSRAAAVGFTTNFVDDLLWEVDNKFKMSSKFEVMLIYFTSILSDVFWSVQSAQQQPSELRSPRVCLEAGNLIYIFGRRKNTLTCR
jgi:hypothetical protein